jgi:hypothetical protein
MGRKEEERWGGEVHLPRWLRRRPRPEDTPEKLAEGQRAKEPEVSVLENADRAMGSMGLGSWMYDELPDGQKDRRRKE